MIKKIFLTSLLLAALASKVNAQQVTDKMFKNARQVLEIEGFVNVLAGYGLQKSDYQKDYLLDGRLDAEGKPDPNHLGTNNHYDNSLNFASDAEIYIKAARQNDSSQHKYGVILELESEISTYTKRQLFKADKGFVFSESHFGKFEFGNNLASNQKMKVGPAIFARATGGISGRYLEHINFPMLAHSTQMSSGSVVCEGGVGVDQNGDPSGNICTSSIKLPKFILTPQSPIGHGGYAKGFYNRDVDNNFGYDADGNVQSNYGSNTANEGLRGTIIGYKNGSFWQMEDATKLSYFSPRINGWQMGLSYTPSSANNGIAQNVSGPDSGAIKDIISLGVNYSDYFDNLGVALSFTSEHGKFDRSKLSSGVDGNKIERNDLNSYDVGLMLAYFGFTFGGSYGNWKKSLQPKTGIYSCDYDSSLLLPEQNCTNINSKKFNDAKYYTLGAAYEFGPVAASITYFTSEFQKNKYNATSIGIDYKISRGLMPYIEYTWFNFKSNKPRAIDLNESSAAQLKDNSGAVFLMGFLLAF